MPAPTTPVTVVIPAYNHGHFVAEAIQSVLLQDYTPIETIVIDDGSTDDTSAVVAGFPTVTYHRQQNSGLAAARNAGLTMARGELIVFLDADDRLLPGAISIAAAILSSNPALGFTAGYSQFITREGQAQPTMQPVRGAGDAYLALLRRNSIRNPGMVMFRREILQRSGAFASGVDACADYELYLRISRDHPVAFHDAVVAEYRKHGGNMSDNASLMLRQLLEVMRRQRPHLRTPEREQAFRVGLANIRSYYGNRIVSQLRLRVRSGAGWWRSMEDVATLAWCHPAGLAEHAARKVRLWHHRRRSDGTRPPYDLNDSAKD